MTATYEFHTLDVFTDHVFGGNPLAVFPDARGLTDEQMQQITREFNLSETVFIFPPQYPANTFRLRIFTPGRELPFAGHPTVGTAHLIAVLGMIPLTEGENRIVFEEGVGPVRVSIEVRGGVPVSAELTAARLPEIRDDVPDAHDIARMLSLQAADIDYGALEPVAASCGNAFLLVPLRDQSCVSRARLDRTAWEPLLGTAWAKEIFIFDGAAAERGEAIRARMFAPDLGIGEDPATGSAAASLAGFLGVRSPDANGTLRWTVEQGVEMGRPSTLWLSAEKSGGVVTAVRVAGRSVMVSGGQFAVPQ